LNSLFHASVAKQMRTALFWAITQRILVISNFFILAPQTLGQIRCPETSVINYHYLLRNDPVE
jgi:hypothetical protein